MTNQISNSIRRVSRRDFLKIVAIGAISGVALKYGAGESAAPQIFNEMRMLMGTVINLEIVGSTRQAANDAAAACFNRMAELETVLSHHQENSQVTRLNRMGFIKDAHPALLVLMTRSRQLSELTSGAFDISVKPLLDLFQSSRELPNVRQIEQARQLVSYKNIAVSDTEISFQQNGMSITLDGIAKGFIVDEGVAVLKQSGFENVMVEAGGDLMGLGSNDLDKPWKIGLQLPRAEMSGVTHTFNVQNQAIATSGDYMQAFTADFLHHHIIDPRSGYSPREFASTSVIAPNAALADGLATAAMVLGRSAFDVFKPLSNCALYAITKDLKIIQA